MENPLYNLDQDQLLDHLADCIKNIKRYKKSYSKSNEAMMNLPPRRGIRGGRNSSIQARHSNNGRMLVSWEKHLKEAIENYHDRFC